MKHKDARARSQLDEFTFGTFNVRTAAVNSVNGIGHIDTLLRYVCMFVCMHVCMYVCMYVFIKLHSMYVCMYLLLFSHIN